MSSAFNWRPLISAPTGAPVATLKIVRHLGGWSRPIDVAPEVRLLVRDSCWRYADLGSGVGDFRGWWTTPEEYAAAVPDRNWRTAPRYVPGFIVCPLVFVRRPDYRYEATVVWSGGGRASDAWRNVHTSSPESPGMAEGYLDRGSFDAHDQPFQWCMPSEFFPSEFFDEEMSQMGRAHEACLDRWSRLSRAPAPLKIGVTRGDYVGDLSRP